MAEDVTRFFAFATLSNLTGVSAHERSARAYNRRMPSARKSLMIKRTAALAIAAALSACATTKSDDAQTKSDAQSKSDDVKIYSPAELRQGSYETVKRLWVDTWRTAFWVPTYSSRDDG